MALNRNKLPVEIPAPSSSSSSEAEDSSSSTEEEQQEEMTRTTPALKPQQQEEEDVDDEDDDEEEEESDEPEKAANTETPSSEKPQSESEDDEESDNGKTIKLSSVSDFAVKVNKSPVLTKRAAENDAGSSQNNNKKAKVVSDGDGKIAVDDSKKKSVFNRVWSEEDEILLLEGFHAYITKNGSDSITNISAFYETLKDLDLSLDVTRSRLYEKLRGLRNKYLNNVRREQKVFSNPHEQKLYEISEKIWGGEVGVVEESGSKKSKRIKKANDVKKEAGSSFPRLGASLESEASTYLPMTAVDPKEFAKNMVLKFEKKKAKELEEEWKEYSLMESQLYAKRVKIMRKQADVLLDVLKSSNLN